MTTGYTQPATQRLGAIEREQATRQYADEVKKLERVKADADTALQAKHADEAKLRAYRDRGDEVAKFERELEEDTELAKLAVVKSGTCLAEASKAMEDAKTVSGVSSIEQADELSRKASSLRREAAQLEERAATFKVASLELEMATSNYKTAEADFNRRTAANARRLEAEHARLAAERADHDTLKRKVQEAGDPNEKVRAQQRIVRMLFARAGMTGYPAV